MSGFSYRGKALSAFGEVYYVPDENIRGDYTTAFKVSEIEPTAQDGGYLQGKEVPAKEFELAVFYENMTMKALNALFQWFARSTSGELIFDDRPYAAYMVTPYKRIEVQDYMENRQSEGVHHGTMTIYLKAYDPFARLLVTSSDADDLMGANDEVTLLDNGKTPEAPDASSRSFLLYNPGTEKTPTLIRIAGDSGDQMTLRNKTTGQECTIKGMTTGITGDAGKVLEINSETGRVELVGAEREMAFEMHDSGYITLAPNRSTWDDVLAKCDAGSNLVAILDGAHPDMVGEHIYLQGAWRKIVAYIDQDYVRVDEILSASRIETTTIVTMNEIEIIGGGLTRLEIEFEPRIR